MTSVAVALPLVIAALTQAPHSTLPGRQQSRATVDLSASTPPATAPAQSNEKPFDKLFSQSLLREQTRDMRQSTGGQQQERRVVCGMVLIPADPAIDAKIAAPAPPDAADAKIRRIVPETCVGNARR